MGQTVTILGMHEGFPRRAVRHRLLARDAEHRLECRTEVEDATAIAARQHKDVIDVRCELAETGFTLGAFQREAALIGHVVSDHLEGRPAVELGAHRADLDLAGLARDRAGGDY